MSLVKKPDPKELFKQVALDIGKEVVHHIRTMYPEAITAASSTFEISVRNKVYNEIMLAMQTKNWVDFIERLEYRKAFRPRYEAVLKAARKPRRNDAIAESEARTEVCEKKFGGPA